MDGDKTNPNASWQFKPDGHEKSQDERDHAADSTPAASVSEEDVSWTASEFIAHDKTLRWYGMLAAATVVVAAAIFFLTHDKISTGAIVFVAIVFGIAAGNRPRVLAYSLGHRDITIGQKSYPYSSFKSYAVVDEGAFSSIMLLPMQRFMPPISIYYDPQDEQRILGVLSERLPLEKRSRDMVERLMSRIRF